MGGDLPAGFRQLRDELIMFLEMMRSERPDKVFYEVVDPFEGVTSEKERRGVIRQLQELGLKPVRLVVRRGESREEKIIFPGAILRYGTRSKAVHFLVELYAISPQEALAQSVALIEYHLVSGVRDLLLVSPPVIGFTEGHGELTLSDMQDFVDELVERGYRVQRVPLRDVIEIPGPPLMHVLVIAKPRMPFREQDKFKIDQFIMKGGKVVWLLEGAAAELDSLRNPLKSFVAFPIDVNLQDMLFNYGVRVNYGLVADMRCTAIPVIIGLAGGIPQQELKPWIFFPVVFPPEKNTHPAVKNLGGVLMRFSTWLDTVAIEGVKKTPLLITSQRSRKYIAPLQVRLALASEDIPPGLFRDKNLITALLLEGRFRSFYAGRLAPSFRRLLDSMGVEFRDMSTKTAMVVIGDGDIVTSYRDRLGNPYPAGYYPYTGQVFANKEFLLSVIEYLWDRWGVVETRSRQYIIRRLDRVKISRYETWIQVMSVLVPVLLLLAWGVVFNYIRYVRFASREKWSESERV